MVNLKPYIDFQYKVNGLINLTDIKRDYESTTFGIPKPEFELIVTRQLLTRYIELIQIIEKMQSKDKNG